VIGPLLLIVVLCGLWIFVFGMWLNMIPGGATRGKWRIMNEKDESELFSCLEQ
jgi:hypothetical protein